MFCIFCKSEKRGCHILKGIGPIERTRDRQEDGSATKSMNDTKGEKQNADSRGLNCREVHWRIP